MNDYDYSVNDLQDMGVDIIYLSCLEDMKD